MFESLKVKGHLKRLVTGDQETKIKSAHWLSERRIREGVESIIKILISLPGEGSVLEKELISSLSLYGKTALPPAFSAWKSWKVNGITSYFLLNRDMAIVFLRQKFMNSGDKLSERSNAVDILKVLDWTPANNEKLNFYLLSNDYAALINMGDSEAVLPLLEKLRRWPDEECIKALKSLNATSLEVRNALVEGVNHINGWHLLKPAWDLVISMNDPQLARDILDTCDRIRRYDTYFEAFLTVARITPCEKCSGKGYVVTHIGKIPNPTPPSYNYGTNGPDYTDPSTGLPMGYSEFIDEYSEVACSQCNGKGWDN